MSTSTVAPLAYQIPLEHKKTDDNLPTYPLSHTKSIERKSMASGNSSDFCEKAAVGGVFKSFQFCLLEGQAVRRRSKIYTAIHQSRKGDNSGLSEKVRKIWENTITEIRSEENGK